MEGEKSDVNGVKGLRRLPDDIVYHIISFLPQQEAAATTMLLSKRFLNLWTTNLPFFHLEFRGGYGPRGRRYCSSSNSRMLEFFEKVLACPRRDKSIVIQKFCLDYLCHVCSDDGSCCLNVTPARVNNLITEVIRQGVREVDLKFRNEWLQFSSPLFASSYDTLTSLNLSCYPPRERIPFGRPFPTLFSFPNLKTMRLGRMVLCTNFASQLINCTKLENLVIWFCNFIDSKLNLIPYDPSCLHPLPNLLKASISLDTYSLDILRVISNAEVLFLNLPIQQQFQEAHIFPKFQNLKKLDVGGILEMDAMSTLLRSSPALESLNIYTLWMERVIGDATLSNCRPSEHLKLVRIKGIMFPDMQFVINFVKYFLEEARGLEKMIINMKVYFELEQQQIVCQALMASPKFDVLELKR